MNKLGQLLVTRGWITVQQLTRALSNQQAVGGRLGTCLLEIEALGEDLLLKGLCEQLGVPAAAIDDLRSVPEDVLATLSPKVARRCRAVPFRLAGGRLDVAMLEPHNLTAQDELAFASGKRIKVHGLHEVRVFEALDRFYGEEAPSRLSHLLERLNRARYLWERGSERPAPPLPSALSTPPGGIQAAAPAPAVRPLDPALSPLRTRPVPAPVAETGPRPVPPSPPAAAAPEPPPATRPVAVPRSGAMTRPIVALTAEERTALGGGTAPLPAVATPAELEDAYAVASDPDEVGRLLLAYLARRHGRAALFQVARDRVTGWLAQGAGIDAARFARFAVGFDQPSVFLNLRQGSGVHLGALPPMAAHRDLAACWGGELPRECLLLPVRLRDRLVMVLYVDGGGAPLGRVDLEAMQRLTAATAAAFQRCILRKKRGGDSGAFGTV
jgi:hypothetical protein